MNDSTDSILSFQLEGVSLNHSYSPQTPSFKCGTSRSLFTANVFDPCAVDDFISRPLNAFNTLISKFPSFTSSPLKSTSTDILIEPLPPCSPICLKIGIASEKQELPNCVKQFTRSFSDSWTESPLKHALNTAFELPDLIGDFSKEYALPTLQGNRNPELKAILPETLRDVLFNKYECNSINYTIIDCRFPYEYDGGHIKNAINLFTRDSLIESFFRNPLFMCNNKLPSNGPETGNINELNDQNSHMDIDVCDIRQIFIFHCEFSQERGPRLYQFLRNYDRQINKHSYPKLNFPELYLLEGGYKNFYQRFPELCEPQDYKPMLHEDHKSELKHFKAKSKSWGGEKNSSKSRTLSKKRSLF